MTDIFSGSFSERDQGIQELLHVEECFDIIRRPFLLGGKGAVLYTIDGFLRGDLGEYLMEYFASVPPGELPEDFAPFLRQKVPYVDITELYDTKGFVRQLLSGQTCLLLEGKRELLALDLREFPGRAVQEPDKDKVLRGSRDGFIESLMPNIALIRRRIRDTNLIFSLVNIGRSSQTDVVICYMRNRVDQKLLQQVKDKLQKISVDSLTMNQQSLSEAFFGKGWFNPFPKFKYTERPDVTAACLLEGSIALLCDNSSSAMILPASLFDITEDANDYYFPPITGTYLRLSRLVINLVAIFLTPVFLLLTEHIDWIPAAFDFIKIKDPVYIPPMIQLLILEVAIDGLRMAAVNTPNMLNTPLSIIAGIVFGDYTVKAGWFNSEIMLYMAFVAIATYSQNNMELGYAIKFMRIQIVLLTGFFGLWGFVAGTLLLILIPLCTRTVNGRKYLYPLIPFDGKQLVKRLLRISLHQDQKWSSF